MLQRPRRRSAAALRCLLAVLAVLAVPAAAACSSSSAAPKHATITVSPAAALLDTPVTVTLHGLGKDATVTVRASARDATGTTWTSAATFRADTAGQVGLGQPALSGSYSGVDPMGLFMLMRPPASDSSAPDFVTGPAGYDVTLRAIVDGSTVATAAVHRSDPRTNDLRVTQLRPAVNGVYGELLQPLHATGRRPGLVMFGGSEGGLNGPMLGAKVLATRGYPVLLLAYFAEPGLPKELHEVPLEYFAKALKIVHALPDVDPRHVLVFGVSRGGEAALLLGATFPSLVNGVIAGVPSSNVNGSYPTYGYAAWTLAGHAVPLGPIAVERIRGPILQACGEQDGVWDSCPSVTRIDQRLAAHDFGYPVTTLRFAGAGHGAGRFDCCYSATTADLQGGTVLGEQKAQVAGHRSLLSFLAAQR